MPCAFEKLMPWRVGIGKEKTIGFPVLHLIPTYESVNRSAKVAGRLRL